MTACFSIGGELAFALLASFKSAETVGFIGLGNMGKGMAQNLMDKGHTVVAFDTNADVLKATVNAGATAATSPKVRCIYPIRFFCKDQTPESLDRMWQERAQPSSQCFLITTL